jgi:E3 ubiquitin-protein ligase NEDD4
VNSEAARDAPAYANGDSKKNLTVTIIAADELYKRDIFRFPDPFAVTTIDGAQTKTTLVIRKTLNPYWNEVFQMRATEDSILSVQIFNSKNFRKKDQGFLGMLTFRVGDIINFEIGGDSRLYPSASYDPDADHATTQKWSREI